MAEILRFNGITRCDITARDVIDNIPRDSKYLMVIGLNEDDDLYIASTTGDQALNVYLLEKVKHIILRDED